MDPTRLSTPMRDGTRVLIVDDDEELCTLTADYLKPLGFQVHAAQTGREGIAAASGEWEAAVPSGTTYRQDGILLFVVPRDLRSARQEIVDYDYPQPVPGAALTLQRTIVAAFDLPRFP